MKVLDVHFGLLYCTNIFVKCWFFLDRIVWTFPFYFFARFLLPSCSSIFRYFISFPPFSSGKMWYVTSATYQQQVWSPVEGILKHMVWSDQLFNQWKKLWDTGEGQKTQLIQRGKHTRWLFQTLSLCYWKLPRNTILLKAKWKWAKQLNIWPKKVLKKVNQGPGQDNFSHNSKQKN